MGQSRTLSSATPAPGAAAAVRVGLPLGLARTAAAAGPAAGFGLHCTAAACLEAAGFLTEGFLITVRPMAALPADIDGVRNDLRSPCGRRQALADLNNEH